MDGQQLEIQVKAKPLTDKGIWGMRLFASPDGEEETRLLIDYEKEQVILDRSQSSLDTSLAQHPLVMPLPESKDGSTLEVQIFLDASTIIEVIVQHEHSLSARVYPTRTDSTQTQLFTEKGQVDIEQYQVYQLQSIWTD